MYRWQDFLLALMASIILALFLLLESVASAEIRFLDGEINFESESGSQITVATLRISSTKNALLMFRLYFVDGERHGGFLNVNANGNQMCRVSSGISEVTLTSPVLGRLDGFGSLRLQYKVDDGAWAAARVDGKDIAVKVKPVTSFQLNSLALPRKMHVHVVKVNDVNVKDGRAIVSLKPGEMCKVTLKIILDNYRSPFYAKAGYKTSNAANFRSLDPIEIDGKEVEQVLQFGWERTEEITVRIVDDDLGLSDTASVYILPPITKGPVGPEQSSWLRENSVYIIAGSLLVFALTFFAVRSLRPRRQEKHEPTNEGRTEDIGYEILNTGGGEEASKDSENISKTNVQVQEFPIDDYIVLHEENSYRGEITIPEGIKPAVSEPDWLNCNLDERTVTGNGKSWNIEVSSRDRFRELKIGTIDLQAEGYRPKKVLVIHAPPTPAKEESPAIYLTWLRRSLKIDLPAGESVAVDVEVKTDGELRLDDSKAPCKLYVPADILLGQLWHILDDMFLSRKDVNQKKVKEKLDRLLRLANKPTDVDEWKEFLGLE